MASNVPVSNVPTSDVNEAAPASPPDALVADLTAIYAGLQALLTSTETFTGFLDEVCDLAKRSFDGSTQIMQTMGEAVLGMRIVKAFNLEDEMRQRMDNAIRVVERSANRMATGGAAATLVADSLAGLAIGKAWERYKLRDGKWFDRRRARESPHYLLGRSTH